jgi:hypothetical protein
MPVYRFGNEAQKQEWLPLLTSGKALGAFGLTEAGGGSDAGATLKQGYVPKLLFIDRAGIVREEHLQRQPEDDYFGHAQSTIRATLDSVLSVERYKKTAGAKVH